ncbi:pfs domain-containing protein [Colletotrichum karsti]|uniref:Pfs domain-containing protein n=1 Tax=Colletotrichum karsti TaxID=1095194 RepID=A0A9P6I121_9PEZI|nr:pfs domain-containing protein [Colletotrichum karsti]KAF9873860.1 pfs domain-containing protein [Colletotrichum karsti]
MAPGKLKALDSPDLYTIGWIAALPIERAAAAAMLDEEHAQPEGFSRNSNDKNSYTWGRIGDHYVVIASLPAGVHGIVPANATASSLLSSLPSIRLGLLVGIGGGIPRPNGDYDIRLGDVIVSQPDGTTGGVCQYDFVKVKSGNRRERKGFLAPPPNVLLHAVANIRSAHELRDPKIPSFLEEMRRQYPKMAKKTKQSPGYIHQGFANDKLFQPSYEHVSSQREGCQSCEVAQEVERDERESADPEIHYGVIASGNTLVKCGIARDRIIAEVGEECICFEMEAAGLMNEFPCLVIRGVCDYADSHKNDQWQRYASATAAAYAKELLAYVPEADVQKTKRASEILQSVDQKLGIVQQASEAVYAKVESIILSDRSQKLREWLAAPDPNTNANHARELRHEGTGTWLLETSTFQEWALGTNRHLWLRGMAGCGKTVLSTTVLDHLTKTDDRTILSFFFDFSDKTKQTKDSLLRSIALQLYQPGRSSVAAHLDDSFRTHQEGNLKPTTANLEELVDKLLTAEQRVVILLDALDESTTRDEIISWIKRIYESLSLVQMFYTSREEAEFMDVFPSTIRKECCLAIDKGATDMDVASYVSARLQTQPDFTRKRLSGDVLDQIRKKVGTGANGM